jgi:hypothetical protein
MKALPSRIVMSLVVAGCVVAPRAALALNASLWVPDGVTKLRGVIACTSVGLGAGWCKSADFQALAKRLEVGVFSLSGENAFASYANRCTGGEFKAALETLAAAGKAAGHPEVANVPIVGCGHSHGGDYWNYFNACFPERFALIFDKSSGGVQYSAAALKTPMVWEVGTNDLKNSMGHFRADMFAHRPKGTPMALVLGPGETHGQLTAGPRAMVIELIEAFFNLRVSKEWDPSSGPAPLNVIDESGGAYWLGDNYTKEVAPYPMSPDKDALYKTSFLPTQEIANHWKMVGAQLPTSITIATGGVCDTCYKQPPGEPAYKPPAGGMPSPPPADAGAEPDAAPEMTPPATPDAASPSTTPTTVKMDAAPAPEPDPDTDVDAGAASARKDSGCSMGGHANTPLPFTVALLLLGLRRRRAR